MGAFDSPADLPNQIKIEGDTITLTFSPGDPETGQGTARWNIPTPALGCNSDSLGAYCGIVILLNERALTIDDVPQDGTMYEADPVAQPDLHAGDSINGSLVVGAFYEGEKKSRGEELTTSFVISGLKPRTSYYVAGYAVDCQGRYHRDGQRAYSDNYGDLTDPGTPGSQLVAFNNNEGTLPTDGTGLVPGMLYEFEVSINPTFPDANTNRIVKISEDGMDISTYQDLVDVINKEFALADNPPQSPAPPDQGRYYWDGEELYQWDGNENQPVDSLKESTDPAQIDVGDYWFNPDSSELKRYNIPSPIGWNDIATISYHKDPTALHGGGDYWYNGTNAYSWCATTWCDEILHTQTTDPGLKPTPDCGVYWFDETNNILYNWNRDFEKWDTVYAISWDTSPNTLTSGTYWYNDNDETLNLYDGTNFSDISYIRLNTEPTGVDDGDLWYNYDTEELKQWAEATIEWIDIPVLVWPEDPRNTESCDLWWDTTSDVLSKWDSVHIEWDAVDEFIQAPTDPYAQPVLEYGELWLNPDDNVMQRWDGIRWVPVTYMEFPTDPTMPPTGTAWHDTENDVWYVYDTPNAGWNPMDPIDSATNPLITPTGTIWFDTATDTLYERQGALTWIPIPYSDHTYYPTNGDTWFDSTNDTLMTWTRDPDRDPTDPTSKQGEWVATTPIAQAQLTPEGNLMLHTTGTGSDKMLMIMIPPGTSYGTGEGLATGSAGLDVVCCHYDAYEGIGTPGTTVGADTFLFDYLVPMGSLYRHVYGSDGVNELPAYKQLGVGDDGSPDERREIADWVRSQLGYPVVDVELTAKQINEAVDMAIDTIRQRTSIAYQRSCFFLDIKPGYQHYALTDESCGFNKVVTVMAAYRFTSAFLSTAHGSGVYGQIVLQHLYNMGTFDLLSYHLVSEYVEQMEHLFATRLVFHWNESERLLSFYQSFSVPERVLLDVTVERTEQSIMKDRWIKTWVRRYALMRGMETLSQIRGKYASLPGAGGGVSLNAADLMTKATELKEELDMEIDDFVANDPEDIGMHSSFILG